jgi:hypothetical protein
MKEADEMEARKAVLKELALLDELKGYVSSLRREIDVYQGLEDKYNQESYTALQDMQWARYDNANAMKYGFQSKKYVLQEELDKLELILSKYN